jgi:hypothetical protein
LFTGASNTIYRDGSAGTTVASSGNFGYSNYGIGRAPGAATDRHIGYVYEVLLYNQALSSNDRQSVEGYLAWKWGLNSALLSNHIYRRAPNVTRPFSPLDLGSNLALWLDATDATTLTLSSSKVTTWFDKSGRGANSTLVNGPTFNSANEGSIVFDGIDDYAEISYSTYWNTNVFGTATNFTLECWYKPDLFKNWDTLIEKSESSGWYSRSEGAAIWTDSTSIQGVFSSGVDGNPAGSATVLSYATTALKWYHIAFTGDGTTLRLYVDGIQRATNLVTSRTVEVYNGSVGPRFGRRAFIDWLMASVKLYTPGIKAVIIETFGAGNASTEEWFLSALKKINSFSKAGFSCTFSIGNSKFLGITILLTAFKKRSKETGFIK